MTDVDTAPAAEVALPEPPVPFRCVVDADLFRRAAMCVSTDTESGLRIYLTGVRVEPCAKGGVIMVSTDGRRMVVIRDPNGWVEGAGIVKLAATTRRALVMSKADARRRGYKDGVPKNLLAVAGGRAVVAPLGTLMPGNHEHVIGLVSEPSAVVTAYQWCGAEIDDKYPDWRRVVPSKHEWSKERVAFDPALLPDIDAALTTDRPLLAGRGLWMITTEYASSGQTKDRGHGPMLVFADCPLGVEGFGIVMPLRPSLDADAFSLPDWLA